MNKSKTQTRLERNSRLKEEFQHLATEVTAKRLSNFSKVNDISVASKQILKGRGIDDYLSILK